MLQLDYEEPTVDKDVMWILENVYGSGVGNRQVH